MYHPMTFHPSLLLILPLPAFHTCLPACLPTHQPTYIDTNIRTPSTRTPTTARVDGCDVRAMHAPVLLCRLRHPVHIPQWQCFFLLTTPSLLMHLSLPLYACHAIFVRPSRTPNIDESLLIDFQKPRQMGESNMVSNQRKAVIHPQFTCQDPGEYRGRYYLPRLHNHRSQ